MRYKLFKGYKIYENGVIKNKKDYTMKSAITYDGYERIALYHNNQYKKYPVHRLVAILFVAGYKEGLQVNHKDGNKLNNNYTNLEWVSLQDNIRHAQENGLTSQIGIKNREHHRKLNNEEIKDIRTRRKNGEKIKSICSSYIHKVSRYTIEDVIHNKVYKEESLNESKQRKSRAIRN